MDLMKKIKSLILIAIFLLAACDTNHTAEFNSIDKDDIAGYEAFIAKYPTSVHVQEAKRYMAVQHEKDVLYWEDWLRDNGDFFIHLFEEVPCEHQKAINDFLSLFYKKGRDTVRNVKGMIQWRLNEFYPVNDDTENKYAEYLNLKKQVDALLDFEVETNGYQVRRKSALMRLMYEFMLGVYNDKLCVSIKDDKLRLLFKKEQVKWDEYCNAASDAFEKVVLGKFLYNFKATFANNYDFDIYNQRIRSLVYLYSRDLAVLGDDVCELADVERGFEDVRKRVESDCNTEYQYSYEEKIEALWNYEKAFKDFLDVHKSLLKELGLDDVGSALYFKARTMDRFFDHYDNPEAYLYSEL